MRDYKAQWTRLTHATDLTFLSLTPPLQATYIVDYLNYGGDFGGVLASAVEDVLGEVKLHTVELA